MAKTLPPDGSQRALSLVIRRYNRYRRLERMRKTLESP